MNRTARLSRLPRSRGNNLTYMKRGIVGFATTVLVSGGLGLAGLGLAAGAAQADPYQPGGAPEQWCPGNALPAPDVVWDMSQCHWYRFSANPAGHGDLSRFIYSADPPDIAAQCAGAPICLPGL